MVSSPNLSMKNNTRVAVIMAGGIGSRFWPMSRTSYPKQFIDFLGVGRTLLQLTYDRLLHIVDADKILIVTNSQYKELVKTQLPDLPEGNILAEPSRKNTAPCIAYASYVIAQKYPDASIIVAPSDHLILKEQVFVYMATEALQHVTQQNCLLTFGITPTRPDTGYGYIQFDDKHPSYGNNNAIQKVKTFTEKPNLEMAKQFLENGDFVWNSGMFCWHVNSIIQAFKNHLPDLAHLFDESLQQLKTEQEKTIEAIYNECKSISIDYGIMEKANNVFVISADIGWSDLGTWGSVYTHLKHDEQGNAKVTKKVLLYESKDCMVAVPKDKLCVVHGLENYIIVDTPEVLLICPKDDEQKIKDFVEDVKLKKWDKYL